MNNTHNIDIEFFFPGKLTSLMQAVKDEALQEATAAIRNSSIRPDIRTAAFDVHHSLQAPGATMRTKKHTHTSEHESQKSEEGYSIVFEKN